MTPTALELEILRVVKEELDADTDHNAHWGKRVTDVRLVGDYPTTTIAVDICENRPPLELCWSTSYELFDGSWDQQGAVDPHPGSVAALVSTDLMESRGAFFTCFEGFSAGAVSTVGRLLTGRLEECLRFWGDGVGAPVRRLVEDRKAELRLGNGLLTVEETDGPLVPPDGIPKRLYSAAMYLLVDDIDAALPSLKPWGAVIGVLEGRDQRTLQVRDPDDNLIQLSDHG